MSLIVINETVNLVEEVGTLLTQEEKQFILQFAFQTDDKELTSMLIQELVVPNKDTMAIMRKYEAICDEKPQWVRQIEHLLVALEMYRIEEEKAINRLSDILGAYGIVVTEEEIRAMDTASIKERVKKEAII